MITQIGIAPACACGSSCGGPNGVYGVAEENNGCGFGLGCGCGNGSSNNFLGSVTEIPIDKVASFVHNAI